MLYCPACGRRLRWRLRAPDDRPRLRCEACGYVFYLDPKVSACAIPVRDGRLYLLRRAIDPGRGRWVFPGGYLERGETVESAARRETEEEVGLRVELEGLVGVYSYVDSVVVTVVYAARVLEGEPRPGPETLEIRTFLPEEIPWSELAFESTGEALRDWLGGRGRRGGA
ncbi:MAG: NUDIX hydrolase [Bacillota bacterium]|nr:NUDIX hydrolase [Bacillota bacterium]MDI3317191.1 NUDIX hydrolase [Bacillota bacterium]